MTFKPLQENDRVETRTLLHEAIPLTGTIISGTYADDNIKDYGHGMFQSVYDYPYLSSSANHIFDITVGVSSQSGLTVAEQAAKKRNIYGQMSQVLMGYDATGSILLFDEDGDLLAGGEKIKEAIVVPFSRLLVKDEIKKETFEMTLGVSASYSSPFGNTITISDVSAQTEYRVNSPAGEYGILYATGSGELDPASTHTASIGGTTYWYAGLLFYQAGVMVLTASVFGSLLDNAAIGGVPLEFNSALEDIDAVLTGSSISGSANDFRNRIQNIQFNNTTELNSTVYFCRVNHNEFNYSSNPTYVSGSKLVVKNQATDEPVSYITTIGLYNDNNELMAVSKLSEPLKKTPSNEFTIRCRLDY
jgi:hypothetical protein